MLFTAGADEEEAVASQAVSPSSGDVSSAPSPTSSNRDRHGRGRIPDEIQREERVHDLTEAEFAAMGGLRIWWSCRRRRASNSIGGPRHCSSSSTSAKNTPGKTPLPESGLNLAEQNVAVARKPPEAIPGGMPGPGLLAQVIVSKYGDHLPLHRLEGIFERQGMRISRQTSDGWVLACAELFIPFTV